MVIFIYTETIVDIALVRNKQVLILINVYVVDCIVHS